MGVRLPRSAVLGALNFVNAIGFVWGFKLTTAFTTSVIQLSIPVLTLGWSTLTGSEKPSALKSAGVLAITVGCVLVALGATRDRNQIRTPSLPVRLESTNQSRRPTPPRIQTRSRRSGPCGDSRDSGGACGRAYRL